MISERENINKNINIINEKIYQHEDFYKF